MGRENGEQGNITVRPREKEPENTGKQRFGVSYYVSAFETGSASWQ